MSINERIKYIRNHLNLTQVKFSERIAISTSYLAGLELGDKKVNERIIRLIVNEFSIDEHWFKTGNGEMFNENSNISVAKITSLFKSLSPQYQACALEQVNALFELERSLKS
jgi:transcriptional regulator with XRE-family HTH domain